MKHYYIRYRDVAVCREQDRGWLPGMSPHMSASMPSRYTITVHNDAWMCGEGCLVDAGWAR